MGAPRHRRPRLAASKKSWVPAPPTAAAQSVAARGADSATAAARSRASVRAAPASTPAVVARAATASTASASVDVRGGLEALRRAHGESRPAGGRSRPASVPGIGGSAADPTSSPPPVDADPNFSDRNLPWATRASASARHTASKTLSIVAAEQVELVDEHHERGLAAVDGAVVGELPRQAEVAAHGLGQVVGGGGHHRVGLGAAGAEAGQPRDRVAHDLVDAAHAGRDGRWNRPGGDHRLDPVERGEEVLARRDGGHDEAITLLDVLAAAEEAAEDPTDMRSRCPSARSARSAARAPRSSDPLATRSSCRSTRSR